MLGVSWKILDEFVTHLSFFRDFLEGNGFNDLEGWLFELGHFCGEPCSGYQDATCESWHFSKGAG